MNCRRKVLTGFAVFIALILAGCGVARRQSFQMSLLPPSAPVAAPVFEPPSVRPAPYLTSVPGFLLEQPKLPPRPTSSDLLIQKAENLFQSGRRNYQAGRMDLARSDFDHAIELMMAASENPSDRHAFEKRFDELVEAIHRYDLAGLGVMANVDEPGFEKSPLDDLLQMTFPLDPKLKNKVQNELLATVSQLPLSLNDAVLGYINYFSGRGHSTIMAGLQRAGRYRPLVQRVLDEEGLPQELIHLAQAESGFLPRALSNKQAAGMWQFLGWRGREYGLTQTPYTDDRLDPEKATRAAARHLRDLFTQFGDWYLAIAAYNCGPITVERAVERTGYADFWELRNRRVLPLETTNYVPIILAMTIMTKNAKEYGLDGVAPDAPLEYDTVEITAPTHLALAADLTGATVYQLRDLNPSILRSVAPAGYSLHVPRGTANELIAALGSIPAERRASWRMHKVESGETLASIGRRYGAAPSSIAAANRLDSVAPVVGDRLVIPAAYQPERKVVTRSVARTRASAARSGGSRAAAVRRGGRRASSTGQRGNVTSVPPRRTTHTLAAASAPRG